MAWGWWHCRQQDWAQAKSAFDQLIRQSPHNPLGYGGLAQWAMAQGQYAQAIPHLQQAIRLARQYPSSATAQLCAELNGQLRLAQGFNQANRIQTISVKGRTPYAVAQAWQAVAQGRLVEQDYPGAQDAAKNALSLNPHLATAKLVLAQAALAQSDWEALNIHEAAVRAQSFHSAWAARISGQIAVRRGQTQTAVQDYRRAIRLAPGDAEAYGALAQLWQQQGRRAEADRVLAQGLRRVMADWDRQGLLLARVQLLESTSPNVALTLANELLVLDPGQFQAYLSQSRIYDRMQQPENAQNALLAAWQVAWTQAGDEPDVLVALGDWAMGQAPVSPVSQSPESQNQGPALLAAAFYEQALQVDPTCVSALSALKQVSDRYGLELKVPQAPVIYDQPRARRRTAGRGADSSPGLGAL
jgi:tetratricopeptide (TPR) repeat protein